ncbi:hypothetical protein [Streptacidiphilus jiangxiensis]|uniref:Uncharacterized protein n=1 Tax=Streptacidiphilus jiangxiensis TaxID=235985 RepID=A0A1H7HX54_STRJI|nr:hypothetical protein [Streptacidiphilus jiangxiensis]SEK54217.1 hypothetical protein SAMN05414137_102374 [Streptacidiphilus jiangxiensis]
MGIADTIQRVPDVVPMRGLSGAWVWSPAPRMHYAAAQDASRQWLFRLNVLDGFDEPLLAAVFAFARSRGSAGSPLGGRSLVVLDGFSHPGYDFDVVCLVAQEVHGYSTKAYPELASVAVGAFPAFRCEFSGTETAQESAARFSRMLRPGSLTRRPSPYVKMRYSNARTRGGSMGSALGFTTVDVLTRELGLLEGAPGSFVEFQNFEQRTFQAVSSLDGTLSIAEGDAEVRVDPEALVALGERLVRSGGPRPTAS